MYTCIVSSDVHKQWPQAMLVLVSNPINPHLINPHLINPHLINPILTLTQLLIARARADIAIIND